MLVLFLKSFVCWFKKSRSDNRNTMQSVYDKIQKQHWNTRIVYNYNNSLHIATFCVCSSTILSRNRWPLTNKRRDKLLQGHSVSLIAETRALFAEIIFSYHKVDIVEDKIIPKQMLNIFCDTMLYNNKYILSVRFGYNKMVPYTVFLVHLSES